MMTAPPAFRRRVTAWRPRWGPGRQRRRCPRWSSTRVSMRSLRADRDSVEAGPASLPALSSASIWSAWARAEDHHDGDERVQLGAVNGDAGEAGLGQLPRTERLRADPRERLAQGKHGGVVRGRGGKGRLRAVDAAGNPERGRDSGGRLLQSVDGSFPWCGTQVTAWALQPKAALTAGQESNLTFAANPPIAALPSGGRRGAQNPCLH